MLKIFLADGRQSHGDKYIIFYFQPGKKITWHCNSSKLTVVSGLKSEIFKTRAITTYCVFVRNSTLTTAAAKGQMFELNSLPS